MSDQAQAVDDPHARMMGILEAEETPSDEDEPALQAEGEEPEELEASEETDEAEEEAEEEATEVITHNGEEKVLTKSALKELAQQGFDYTQKTQALADQRRAVEAREQVLQTQVAIHTQLSDVVAEVKSLDSQIAQYKQVNWSDLAEQDPVQYLKLNQTYRDLKEARDEKAQEYNQQAQHLSQVQAQNREQALQAEAKLLAQKVPEFAGPKASEVKAQLASFLTAEGFSPAEVGSIMDHRMVSVAWKAAQYDKLKAAKPEINKRVAEAPKLVKGKQPVNQQTSASRDLREKLRRTGDSETAAKLIEQML